MSRFRLALAAATLIVTGVAVAAASAAPFTFQAQLHCRADVSFVGTVELSFIPAGSDYDGRQPVGVLTCSDANRNVNTTIDLNISDWENDAFAATFTNTAFVDAGCVAGMPVAALENTGYGDPMICGTAPEAGNGRHNGDVWMELSVFSAGDQPGYIGQDCPSPRDGCGNGS